MERIEHHQLHRDQRTVLLHSTANVSPVPFSTTPVPLANRALEASEAAIKDVLLASRANAVERTGFG